MVVVGKNCTVLNETGRHAEVSPFVLDYERIHKVHVVDDAVEHDDKYSGKSFLLVLHGALLVTSMDHDLVPLLMLSESDLEVDTMPKQNKTSHQWRTIQCVLRK